MAQPDHFRFESRRRQVEFAQLPVDFIAIEPDSIQIVDKRPDITNRSCIIRIDYCLQERQRFISFIRSRCSGHTMTVHTKWRFQREVFMNGLKGVHHYTGKTASASRKKSGIMNRQA